MRTYTPATERRRLDAVTWAVKLGANTAKRLADEWRISPAQACQHLLEGFEHGRLGRTKVGQGFEYRVAE